MRGTLALLRIQSCISDAVWTKGHRCKKKNISSAALREIDGNTAILYFFV
jgi:hypothetical protein